MDEGHSRLLDDGWLPQEEITEPDVNLLTFCVSKFVMEQGARWDWSFIFCSNSVSSRTTDTSGVVWVFFLTLPVLMISELQHVLSAPLRL